MAWNKHEEGREKIMNLLYQSTRGGEKGLTASQAILKGLSDDGGLFMPVEIPVLDIPVENPLVLRYRTFFFF